MRRIRETDRIGLDPQGIVVVTGIDALPIAGIEQLRSHILSIRNVASVMMDTSEPAARFMVRPDNIRGTELVERLTLALNPVLCIAAVTYSAKLRDDPGATGLGVAFLTPLLEDELGLLAEHFRLGYSDLGATDVKILHTEDTKTATFFVLSFRSVATPLDGQQSLAIAVGAPARIHCCYEVEVGALEGVPATMKPVTLADLCQQIRNNLATL